MRILLTGFDFLYAYYQAQRQGLPFTVAGTAIIVVGQGLSHLSCHGAPVPDA